MAEKDGVEGWVKKAVDMGYNNGEIRDLLEANGYTPEQIKEIMTFRVGISKEQKSKPKIQENKSVVQDDKSNKEEQENKKQKDKGQVQAKKIPEEIKSSYDLLAKVRTEVGKIVIGQKNVVDACICALLCDGHVLIEGVPGIAKTLLIKALAEASGCYSKRIQFTVDLLPSDILGVTTYTPQRGFETIKGPIFANFVIADEINRSPPKTQSAMIEAMQEKQVTIAKETYPLPLPFFVMANNNPLEQSGVYELPEAQVDRFLFKITMGYPKTDEEIKIMEENVTLRKFETFKVQRILSPQKILEMQNITKSKIYMDDKIKRYIVKIVDKTRTRDFKHGEYIDWGGSPRASIGLFIASKGWALIKGRNFVIPQDVKDVAHFVLRHRIILNYKARAEGIDSDKIIDEVLGMVNV